MSIFNISHFQQNYNHQKRCRNLLRCCPLLPLLHFAAAAASALLTITQNLDINLIESPAISTPIANASEPPHPHDEHQGGGNSPAMPTTASAAEAVQREEKLVAFVFVFYVCLWGALPSSRLLRVMTHTCFMNRSTDQSIILLSNLPHTWQGRVLRELGSGGDPARHHPAAGVACRRVFQEVRRNLRAITADNLYHDHFDFVAIAREISLFLFCALHFMSSDGVLDFYLSLPRPLPPPPPSPHPVTSTSGLFCQSFPFLLLVLWLLLRHYLITVTF